MEKQVAVVEDSWLQDYLKMYPQVPINEIEVGMPATYYVGTDSYATEVAEIVRFKNGLKAGEIKYITVKGHYQYRGGDKNDLLKLYPKEQICFRQHEGNRLSPTCVDCWLWRHEIYKFKNPKHSASVVVGYAKDYRDPHF